MRLQCILRTSCIQHVSSVQTLDLTGPVVVPLFQRLPYLQHESGTFTDQFLQRRVHSSACIEPGETFLNNSLGTYRTSDSTSVPHTQPNILEASIIRTQFRLGRCASPRLAPGYHAAPLAALGIVKFSLPKADSEQRKRWSSSFRL